MPILGSKEIINLSDDSTFSQLSGYSTNIIITVLMVCIIIVTSLIICEFCRRKKTTEFKRTNIQKTVTVGGKLQNKNSPDLEGIGASLCSPQHSERSKGS